LTPTDNIKMRERQEVRIVDLQGSLSASRADVVKLSTKLADEEEASNAAHLTLKDTQAHLEEALDDAADAKEAAISADLARKAAEATAELSTCSLLPSSDDTGSLMEEKHASELGALQEEMEEMVEEIDIHDPDLNLTLTLTLTLTVGDGCQRGQAYRGDGGVTRRRGPESSGSHRDGGSFGL